VKGKPYQREDGLWDWRIRAANHKIVATSGGQGYVNRYGAKRALAAFVDESGADVELEP
jgi:uncharacterized protein YegP (UPF0339 family)